MTHDPTIWIEIDLSAIRHNLKEVRGFTGRRVETLAVVKADAYGHGAVEVSRAVIDEGARYLGVTRIEDAVALRNASIDAPILVFSPCLPPDANTVVEYDLDQTVCSTSLSRALSDAASARGRTARVHIKVDTGLGRLGVSDREAVGFVRAVSGLSNVEIAGIYTHFATAAEKDDTGLARQLKAFDGVLRGVRSANIVFGAAHAAASAAILRAPDSHYDIVRPGTVLYGQYPSPHVPRILGLRNTWTLKTRVVAVRTLPKGAAVGYGSEYRTSRRSTIGVLPAGYADGLTMLPESVSRRNVALKLSIGRDMPSRPKQNSDLPRVKIRGKSVPIIGRVAMEMCVVDLTDLPESQVGDEVILPCRRTAAASRIPRLYIR
ncbi:MAG: alanine racemase [Armatimonadota bacterium]|nr:alanine racemase [Armatimonadota bacterium]